MSKSDQFENQWHPPSVALIILNLRTEIAQSMRNTNAYKTSNNFTLQIKVNTTILLS